MKLRDFVKRVQDIGLTAELSVAGEDIITVHVVDPVKGRSLAVCVLEGDALTFPKDIGAEIEKMSRLSQCLAYVERQRLDAGRSP
jgi:hypothetical protein